MEFVEKNFHRDYFQAWFLNLCPSFLRKPEHFEKYKALLAKYKGTDKTLFVKLLKNEIDNMENLQMMAMKNKIRDWSEMTAKRKCISNKILVSFSVQWTHTL